MTPTDSPLRDQLEFADTDSLLRDDVRNLGAMVGDQFVVASGHKPGERVITDGLQKIKPGQKVTLAKPKAAPARAGKP